MTAKAHLSFPVRNLNIQYRNHRDHTNLLYQTHNTTNTRQQPHSDRETAIGGILQGTFAASAQQTGCLPLPTKQRLALSLCLNSTAD
jgi:hypothetical protein